MQTVLINLSLGLLEFLAFKPVYSGDNSPRKKFKKILNFGENPCSNPDQPEQKW